MVRRTGMSQVKFKVRHNALMLREFTVADIVRATRLNPESVRTELQRMKQEGLLTSGPLLDRPKKRGGCPALYRLTEDSEARLMLSESIEAFYPAAPSVDKPTSRHYLLAQQTLSRAQMEDDRQRRERLLDLADHDLEMAEQAEGGSLASRSVKAYLEYECARLAYLRGKYEDAQLRFEALRSFFVTLHDEILVQRTDEFLLCLKSLARFSADLACGGVDEIALARCLLETLAEEAYQVDSPLASLVLQLLSKLSQTADERIRAAAFDLAVKVSRREIRAEIRESLNVEQVRGAYELMAQGKQLRTLDWRQRDEL